MSEPLHAYSIWVGRCGKKNCRAVHIDYVDEDGNVIACAAIPVEHVRGFTENIRNCAYDVVASGDEP
jgi:hypothetical protein